MGSGGDRRRALTPACAVQMLSRVSFHQTRPSSGEGGTAIASVSDLEMTEQADGAPSPWLQSCGWSPGPWASSPHQRHRQNLWERVHIPARCPRKGAWHWPLHPAPGLTAQGLCVTRVPRTLREGPPEVGCKEGHAGTRASRWLGTWSHKTQFVFRLQGLTD